MAIIECKTCHGDKIVACDWCKSTCGKMTYKIHIGNVWENCTKCNGKGTMTCPKCEGLGKLYNQ